MLGNAGFIVATVISHMCFDTAFSNLTPCVSQKDCMGSWIMVAQISLDQAFPASEYLTLPPMQLFDTVWYKHACKGRQTAHVFRVLRVVQGENVQVTLVVYDFEGAAPKSWPWSSLLPEHLINFVGFLLQWFYFCRQLWNVVPSDLHWNHRHDSIELLNITWKSPEMHSPLSPPMFVIVW